MAKPDTNAQADLDTNYELLTKIKWSGTSTPAIKWERNSNYDNIALASFGSHQDARQFISFLDFWSSGNNSILKKRDTDESIRLRGIVREDYLPKESQADRIQIPPQPNHERPTTIRIPLEIIDGSGLQAYVEQQTKLDERRSLNKAQEPSVASTWSVAAIASTAVDFAKRTFKSAIRTAFHLNP